MSKNKFSALITGTALVALASGCSQPTSTTNANGNTNTANTNTANAVANVNLSPAAESSPVITTAEPDEYRATVVLKARTTGGERTLAIPELSAEVARSGVNRRISFNMPNGEQVIYLNRGDTRYVILPNRKQYAELTPEAAGFEMPRLMMPDQLVDYLKRQRSFERVGEEQMNRRTVVKYRAAGTARTGTRAGDVSAETFVYVDKETGLPVQTEMLSETSGNAQGVNGVRVVTEMRNIQTSADPSLFEVPQGMNKVTAEQVRQQVNTVVTAATAIAGALLNNMNQPPATASPAPTGR